MSQSVACVDVHRPEITKDVQTRGNAFKLDKGRAKYDLRKYYFTSRVVNASNSLPDHVVGLFSETRPINTFKSRLDKFWQIKM